MSKGGGGAREATLIVSSSGESLLIDSGFPGERDAGRIAAAATDVGVEQIDYHMVTHLHADHMGGAELDVRNDYGEPPWMIAAGFDFRRAGVNIDHPITAEFLRALGADTSH